MRIKFWSTLLRIALCAVIYLVFAEISRLIPAVTGWAVPAPATGEDPQISHYYVLLIAPLMALSLFFVARGLAGSFLTRTLALAFLSWIAYSVNNALEGLVFASYASDFLTQVLQGILPCLACSAAAAHLFQAKTDEAPANAWKTFFSHRKVGTWIWRLILAGLSFAPIYFIFGLLVQPLIIEYYQQNVGGLQQPDVGKLFIVLFTRSFLFCTACLPAMVLWKKSNRSLFFSLGLALSLWVGLIYLLTAYWLPVNLRLFHAIEILADEFLYAAVLLWLLRSSVRSKYRAAEMPTLEGGGAR